MFDIAIVSVFSTRLSLFFDKILTRNHSNNNRKIKVYKLLMIKCIFVNLK